MGQSRTPIRRLAVISDDEGSRLALESILKRRGYDVVERPGLTGASEFLSPFWGPQVVLFDFRHGHQLGRLMELTRTVWPRPVVAVPAVPNAPTTPLKTLGHAGLDDGRLQPGKDLEQTIVEVFSRLSRRTGSDRCLECSLWEVCFEHDETAGAAHQTGVWRASLAGEAGARPFTPFIVASSAMRTVQRTARQVADSDVTVLLTGESGVGKEVVARYIHRIGPRSQAPFVKVNCAALPESLLENELFGHERGAFTGASSQQAGKFRAAHRGVIFLDEVSELSGRLQAKLLQVLQNKEFTQLGGSQDIRVDVHVLAATNRNLGDEVAAGRFREDLYFRLNVVELYVPPLRERREAIPFLLDYFKCWYAKQHRRPVPKFSGRIYDLFLSDRWPGNVRQLENVVRRAVLLRDEEKAVEGMRNSPSPRAGVCSPRSNGLAFSESVAEPPPSLKEIGQRAALEAERDLILTTLETTRWNRRKASRRLRVSYKTLLTKMKQFGLMEEGVRPACRDPATSSALE